MASKQIVSDGSLIWQDDPPNATSPLSGHGASRQARRMQLRNAGFRGPAIPGRKVTPKSLSSSNWSNMSSGQTQSSDAENQSPSGNRASLSIGKRRGSGVLAEIGNATLTRPKKHHARPRITSAKFYSSNIECRRSGEYDAAFPTEHPSPKSAPKLRSAKVKGKLGAKRRSVSGETKKYVDHLEAELASTQSQLSAVTSPSITRQQTNMMRSLNAETKQLQEALEEWENKYDERVQEIVEQHTAIAIGLRSQLRSHEEQGEEDRYRIHELEEQVGVMRQNLESAEVANVQLEKRLEVLSDILATSAKIDLHAETPGRLRRMSRPKSVHLRFPTTGNLMISPERLSESGTQPPSPALSFAGSSHSHLDLRQTQSHQEFTSGNMSQSEQNSDAESVFSDVPILGDSFTSAEPSLITHHAHFDMPPPSLPPRGRPTRRMRRFGAGSIGPRPLILPSASHYDHVPASHHDHVPASAPAHEFHEQSRDFPFRDQSVGRSNGSPLMGRRRASTMMDQTTLASLAGSDHLTVPGAEEADDDMPSFTSPASAISRTSVRDYPSLGSCAGAAISRNLMEELSQIRSNDMTSESNDLDQEGRESAPEDQEDDTELQDSFTDPLEPIPESHSREVSDTSHSTATVMGLQPCTSATPTSDLSFIARLRRIFGDLWRSPVELARHLVQRAQACMRLPAPLRNVQWWLVSMLLGPMAKRRLLSTHHNHSRNYDDDRERLLIPEQEQCPGSPNGSSHDLAYGNFYPSSPEARASKRSRRPGMAGPGKKVVSYRSGSSTARRNTHHLVGLGRHSPWLWLKFSITLAFAIGCAFKSGPGSLLSAEEECPGCERCGASGQRARCATPS